MKPNKPQFQPPNEPRWAQMSPNELFWVTNGPKTLFLVNNRILGQNQQKPGFFPSKLTKPVFSVKIDETPFFFGQSPFFFNQNQPKQVFRSKSTKTRFLGQKAVFFQSKSTKTTFFGQNRPKPVCLVKLHRNHPKTSPFQLGPNTQS